MFLSKQRLSGRKQNARAKSQRRRSWRRAFSFETLESRALLATVTSVTTSGLGIASGSGRLNMDDVATLMVNFDASVTVNRTNGSPTLTLNTGAKANFVGGSGTAALAFQYIVTGRENTSDLAVTAMSLNGSTIQESGINATLTGAVTNPAGALVVDTTSPTVTISRVGAATQSAGTTLQFSVAFSEDVTGVSASSFNLTTTGVTGAAVSSVVQGANAATYTVNVTSGGAGTIGLNLGGSTIKDLAGNGFGGGSFSVGSSFSSGTGPSSIAAADLNADGNMDWVVTNSTTNNVSVMLGNGSGGVSSGTNFAVGATPVAATIMDVNADGRPDIVVANSGTSSISVLIGSGNGSFGTATSFGTAAGPRSLAVGDFNSDGKPDLAIAYNSTTSMGILLGNGTGGFGTLSTIAASAGTRYVETGDVNADGRPDLISASTTSSNVSVQLATGAATFGSITTYAVGNSQIGLALNDFNNDGKLDIAVTNGGTPNTQGRVILGTGVGTFGSPITYVTAPGPWVIETADLNGDNNVDLGTLGSSDLAFALVPGFGSGSFGTPVMTSVGGLPNGLALADINKDGRLDAIISNVNNGVVGTLINNKPNTVGPVFTITNQAPTDSSLSNNTVREEQFAGALVGMLSTTDADANDTFTYTLVSGTGSTDNSSFRIVGNQLQTNAILDYETKSSFSVRVRSTDSGGLNTEKAFAITVLDELEAQSPTLIQQIQPPSTLSSNVGAQFGRSIAVSNNYYLVGAPNANLNDIFGPGQAVLYSAVSGQRLFTFNNPSPGNSDQMGFSGAISGNTVVLGAYFDEVGTTMAGRAMIFDASTGSLNATLNNPTPAVSDMFGNAVAIGGGLITVGARADDAGSTNSGAVHIYNTSGSFQRTLTNPQPSVGAFFGHAVAMEGTTLAVASSDAVYIYNASTGALLRTIVNPTGVRTDSFATSISLFNSKLAVGSQSALVNGVRSGNVRIYDANTGALSQTYATAVGAIGDNFGAAVSLDAQSLIVGAPGTDISGISNVGAAYLYDITNGSLRGGMSNPAPGADDQFGSSVAVLGVKALVGAPIDDSNGVDHGNVFVYSRVAPFALGLTGNTAIENNSIGSTIGSLSVSTSANQPVTYALISGTGGNDNSSFTITGNLLKATTSFNFEVKSTYSILVEATDAQGLKVSSIFTITVQDINEAPTMISISNTSLTELQPVGSVIGTLTTTDPDANQSFAYSLTSGSYPDNSFFNLQGSQLVSLQSFDYEARKDYQVEIRSQDSAGLSTTRVFTITINNFNQPVVQTQPRYGLRIVSDINSTVQDSSPANAVELGGFTYFTATAPATGRELYRLNALTGDTERVTDLLSGTGNADPQSLVVMGGALYFTASYSYSDPLAPPGGLPETRFGIFKSNGTANGTELLSQVVTTTSSFSTPKPGYVVGSRVLFFIGNESDGEQLWATNGTAAGTSLIKAFDPAIGPSSTTAPAIVAGGFLYMNRSVDSFSAGHALWRTDGTASGTLLLRESSSMFPPSFNAPFDPSLSALGSTVFFVSSDSNAGMELWKTTGTVGSTQRVQDLNLGMDDSGPNGMVAFGGSLYFSAFNSSVGRELWKTNGTSITLVKDINSSTTFASLNPQSEKFTVFGSHLYFVADDGTGSQLWRTNGTEVGTTTFTSDGTTAFIPDRLVALPQRLLIAGASYGPLANQLWSTDGTQSGNQFVTNYFNINQAVAIGNQAFLGLDNGTLGTELWVTDGVSSNTRLLLDVRPGSQSGLGNIFSSQGRAVFTGNNGVQGNELGISDGTVVGSRMIDVARGTLPTVVGHSVVIGNTMYIPTQQGLYSLPVGSTMPVLLTTKVATQLTVVGTKLFFVAPATTDPSNLELWVSNGTAAGTSLVYDIRTGSTGSQPEQLLAFNGLLYFVANDGINGKELWRSGGVPNDPLNTRLFYQFGTSNADGNIQQMIVVGDKFYVQAGNNLYILTDGSSFTLLATGASSLMPWNGVVYFSGYTAETGTELWRTDGTVAGTYLVRDIVPGPLSSFPGGGVIASEDSSAKRLATTETRLVFRALDPSGASQLFATNGTSSGTVALTSAPLVNAGFGLVPFNLFSVGNQVYFQGYSQANGLELWTSDGTVSGTRLVKDLRPGSSPDPFANDPNYEFSSLQQMNAFREKLFFSVATPASGRELWVSDGSELGSYQAIEIREGLASGLPKQIFVSGNQLYLTADTDDFGVGSSGNGELFQLNESPYLNSQATTVVSGGTLQLRLDGLDIDGDSLSYQLNTPPQHGTVTISGNVLTYISAAGYFGADSFGVIANDGLMISDEANFRITARSSVPTITFTQATSSVSEAEQVVVANVSLSVPASENLNIPFVYGFGDQEQTGIVSFAAGQATSQVIIPLANDNVRQTSQMQLEITLQSNEFVGRGAITQHVTTILDDDAVPQVFFVEPLRTVSETAGIIGIELGLTSATEATVTATVSLNSVLGGNSSDFTFAPMTQVTFLPGQLRQRVLVRVIDNQIPDSREGFVGGLSSVTNATIIGDPNRFRSLTWVEDDDISIVNVSPLRVSWWKMNR